MRRKDKRKQTRESAAYQLIKHEVENITGTGNSKTTKHYEKKIYRAVKVIMDSGKLKRRHLLFYILLHSYDTPIEFSVKLLKIAKLKTGENIRRIKKVRTFMLSKSGSRRKRLNHRLEQKSITIFRIHTEIEETAEPSIKKELKQKLEKYTTERKSIFDLLSRIKIVPSCVYLGELLGVSTTTIQYGVKKAEKMIMEMIGSEC